MARNKPWNPRKYRASSAMGLREGFGYHWQVSVQTQIALSYFCLLRKWSRTRRASRSQWGWGARSLQSALSSGPELWLVKKTEWEPDDMQCSAERERENGKRKRSFEEREQQIDELHGSGLFAIPDTYFRSRRCRTKPRTCLWKPIFWYPRKFCPQPAPQEMPHLQIRHRWWHFWSHLGRAAHPDPLFELSHLWQELLSKRKANLWRPCVLPHSISVLASWIYILYIDFIEYNLWLLLWVITQDPA